MTAARSLGKPSGGKPQRFRSSSGVPLAAVLGHGDLASSLIAIFPLFLIYEIGVAFTPAMNGVDFVSRNLFALVNYNRQDYLLIHGSLALAFLIYLFVSRKRASHPLRRFPPMLAESIVYALTLGSFIVFVMRKLLGIEPSLATGGLTNVLLSCGAGVHEELVFRLGICAGGAALLRLIGVRHVLAVAAAFLVSSMLFSAAHHLGPMGEPFTWSAFIYRTLAGLIFAAIFYYRSLGHAAYTHALYDVWVLVLR
jgi:Type II CAAX prenyl endopeptidase Rce1-like